MSVTVVATSAFGLEAVVVRELAALGYAHPKPRVKAGRIRFEADDLAICRCNMWLRSADRVMVEVGNFSAPDFDALFDQTMALPWEDWLPANARFPVNGKSVRSQLTSVPALQRSVKKAIVNRLCRHYGLQRLPEDGPTFSIEVGLLDNEASLLLDTSGLGLHKRGYGGEVGTAPLKETMAAAMVQLSYWRPDRPFLDPFCGSGTLPIEAAFIGLKQAPGRHRRFDGEHWPRLAAGLWRNARNEADELLKRDVKLEILGSDIDGDAVAMAERRAAEAGVAEHIRFDTCDVFELGDLPEYGCMIANPPYGERLSTPWDVIDMYRDLPRVFARMPTWSLYVLTSVADTEKLFGRRADRRRKLYNARIECTYFQFYGPRPPRKSAEPKAAVTEEAAVVSDDSSATPKPSVWDASVARREKEETAPPAAAFGQLPEFAEEQAETLAVRLKKRARHFRRWPTKQGIGSFRLYNQDVPGVAMVIDRYQDALHVTDYTKPHKYPPAQHQAWLDLMKKTIIETLDADPDRVFVKTRQRQVGKTQHERVAARKQTFVVDEGGLRFEVNLSDYVDTGLFLDHRQTRGMIREMATGKDVLNLFCYTGSFSVYAAAGGARSTCSVDLSNTYIDWTKRNLLLNGFEGKDHRLVRGDVMTHLRGDPALYDIAIVDPPTFSNSKSTATVWDVQRDHAELIGLTLERLRPGGVCFFSTNMRKFKFDAPEVESACEVREITNQTLPPDFVGGKGAHRCWRITKAK